MRRRAAAAVGVVAAVAVFALTTACGSGGTDPRSGRDGSGSSTSRPLPNMVPDPPIVVGALGLPDVSAEPPADLGFHAEPGRLLVVYFGYTNCPDVCPTALADLSAATALLKPAERARVQVALVTVDPRRDTPDVLRRYVGHFFDGAHALRTDDEQLQEAVQAAFGVQVTRKPPDRNGDYAVDHTSALFPVDAGGRVQVMWLTGMEPSEIAEAIRALLRRVADPAGVTGIVVRDASLSPPPSGSRTATASMILHNAGTRADELTGARVAVGVAERAELAGPVALPPRADAAVGPGGVGLVLTGVEGTLVPGSRVPVRLTFRRSPPQTVMMPVAGGGTEPVAEVTG
ncbi:MAG: SCO family protein [Acidimicrobiia bacterium]|nr:SCO family protein [Acidimicrobiia bacterium]